MSSLEGSSLRHPTFFFPTTSPAVRSVTQGLSRWPASWAITVGFRHVGGHPRQPRRACIHRVPPECLCRSSDARPGLLAAVPGSAVDAGCRPWPCRAFFSRCPLGWLLVFSALGLQEEACASSLPASHSVPHPVPQPCPAAGPPPRHRPALGTAWVFLTDGSVLDGAPGPGREKGPPSLGIRWTQLPSQTWEKKVQLSSDLSPPSSVIWVGAGRRDAPSFLTHLQGSRPPDPGSFGTSSP